MLQCVPTQQAWLKAVCLRAGARLSRQPDTLCLIRRHLSQRLDVGTPLCAVTANNLSDSFIGGESALIQGCKPEGLWTSPTVRTLRMCCGSWQP